MKPGRAGLQLARVSACLVAAVGLGGCGAGPAADDDRGTTVTILDGLLAADRDR